MLGKQLAAQQLTDLHPLFVGFGLLIVCIGLQCRDMLYTFSMTGKHSIIIGQLQIYLSNLVLVDIQVFPDCYLTILS